MRWIFVAFSQRRASQEERHGGRRFIIQKKEFVLLLIGNDWKKKGLDTALSALAQLSDLPLRLRVVGSDDPTLYQPTIKRLKLSDCIAFQKPQSDVLAPYAAADSYVGPSLEDAFNLPILEAMACGLPVIASVQAGASENIRDYESGLLLRDPQDPLQLGRLLRNLFGDVTLRQKIGTAASCHVRENCSWDRNAAETRQFLEATLGSPQKA